jgi:hypothetical protein
MPQLDRSGLKRTNPFILHDGKHLLCIYMPGFPFVVLGAQRTQQHFLSVAHVVGKHEIDLPR